MWVWYYAQNGNKIILYNKTMPPYYQYEQNNTEEDEEPILKSNE